MKSQPINFDSLGDSENKKIDYAGVARVNIILLIKFYWIIIVDQKSWLVLKKVHNGSYLWKWTLEPRYNL